MILTSNNTFRSLFTADGQYLFSLTIPDRSVQPFDYFVEIVFLLSVTGILLLIGYLIRFTLYLSEKKGHGPALVFLFLFLFLVRSVMLWVNYPFKLIEADLFNSKFFASSVFSPSLGDFFLNLLFFLIFSIVLLKKYSRLKVIRRVFSVDPSRRHILSVVILSANLFFFYYLFDLLLILYSHSQWEVDITESIDPSFLKAVSFLILIILFLLLLIYTYIFSKLYLSLNKKRSRAEIYYFMTSTALLVTAVLLHGTFSWQVVLTDLIFYIIILHQRIPSVYLLPRYKSYLYLLLSAIFFSILSAFSVYQLKLRNDTINREKFASQLLVENDVLGEYLLNEASMFIKNDQFIVSVLLNPFTGKEVIEQKIKRVYLGTYFDKYDINVYVFDALGNSFNVNQEFNYWPDVISNYKLPQFRTDYPNIYLLYDAGNQDYRRYLSFVKIRKGGAVIGYILIELKQKRVLPHSVYPELLVDEKFSLPYEDKNYSYVIYGQSGIINSYGEFNYEKYFTAESLKENKRIFNDGITRSGYHHIAMRGTEGKVVIVSSPEYSWERFFSNFSFYFFLLMFFILFIIAVSSALTGLQNLNLSFSTKIQIYLNLAFFLPLIIVSITTLSIISSSYKENLNESFIKKAESVSNAIYTVLESDGKVTTDGLEEVLVEKSRFMETDINFFDNKGRLVFSNKPIIYDAGLFAKVVNPEAYSRIQDYKNNIFMLPEKVGGFNYNAVYIAIRAYGSGNVLGILSIPFFESKQELDKQIIEVLTTILNIFVSIFLVFLLLSYLVSKLLTVPLELITQKLSRTNLSTRNEPLEWNSHDEIGLLIGEYNRMLVKLEESKDALSRSEKESAWREMAQQVAHEIKNPLTPMKLSIQHLQRALNDRRENINEMFEKSLPVLLDQVNTLSEIATSFSAFAKMPIPRNEHFEITGVFASITRLHSADQSIDLSVETDPGPVYIMGDQQLLGNIISNLVINAIQSVPADRNPQIKASLVKKGKSILIKIKDNGTGIPESIREKVFLPNFSTKYSGSGLGLALARRGVEHAGGKIWFETIEGEGTTFFIELPIAE